MAEFNSKNKFKIFTLLILLICIQTVIALEPNYNINLDLSNHNIKTYGEGGYTKLKIDVMGYGSCEKSQITIMTEIPLEYSNDNQKLYNAHSLYDSDLKESELKLIDYCVNKKCFDEFPESFSTDNIDLNLDKSLFSTDETRIRTKLEISMGDSLAGGEYSIKAIFFCKNLNKTYIFEDEVELRVMYPEESSQYSIGFWAFIISVIAILITVTKDFFMPFLFKPRLFIEGYDDGECVQDANSNLNTQARWIRLRLTNGKNFWHRFFGRSAKNCYVKLLWIQNSEMKKVMPFESLPLTWVNYDDFTGNRYNLGVGEDHMIDLVHEYPNERILRFKISVPTDLLREARIKLRPGKYTFKVAVYGDNFKPISKQFKIQLTDKFGEINFIN